MVRKDRKGNKDIIHPLPEWGEEGQALAGPPSPGAPARATSGGPLSQAAGPLSPSAERIPAPKLVQAQGHLESVSGDALRPPEANEVLQHDRGPELGHHKVDGLRGKRHGGLCVLFEYENINFCFNKVFLKVQDYSIGT